MTILSIALAALLVTDDPVLAFEGVNVVAMTHEAVWSDQTVVIRAGRIAAIGPAETVPIPSGAIRIDGRGRFLIPGLADMHVHLRHEEDLALNVVNGVTTVLDMGGPPAALPLRTRVEEGEIIGPRIFAGLFVDGVSPSYEARSPEEALARVHQAQIGGWDFIKAYNSLDASVFDALMTEASEQGMPVFGHAVRSVGLEHELAAGVALIAHAEEYLYGHFDEAPDRAAIEHAVHFTSEAGAAVVPTLSAYELIADQWGARGPAHLAGALASPHIGSLRPERLAAWVLSGKYAGRAGDLDGSLQFQRGFVHALHAGGVPLLVGTDTPSNDIVGAFPGSRIHAELKALAQCGLSNYAVLSAATSVPGRFIDEQFAPAESSGTIEVGKRADLLLLDADPLADLANVQALRGVVLNGRWLDREHLDSEFERRQARKFGYLEEEVRFASEDVELAGTLFLPEAGAPHPAVVVTHGSERSNRTSASYRSIATRFARRGVAALIYDKRGVGDSGGEYVEAPDLSVPAGDLQNAIHLLLERPEIDDERIGVWGASQGGWVGPLAATECEAIAFVVSVSGPGVSPLEQNLFDKGNQLRPLGFGEEEIERVTEVRRAYWTYLVTGEGYERAEKLWMRLDAEPLGHRIEWTIPFMKREAILKHPRMVHFAAHSAYEPGPTLERLRVPMLAVFGAEDTIVPVEESVARMRAAFERNGEAQLSVHVFEGADHGVRVRGPNGQREFAPGYWALVENWVLQVVGFGSN